METALYSLSFLPSKFAWAGLPGTPPDHDLHRGSPVSDLRDRAAGHSRRALVRPSLPDADYELALDFLAILIAALRMVIASRPPLRLVRPLDVNATFAYG